MCNESIGTWRFSQPGVFCVIPNSTGLSIIRLGRGPSRDAFFELETGQRLVLDLKRANAVPSGKLAVHI